MTKRKDVLVLFFSSAICSPPLYAEAVSVAESVVSETLSNGQPGSSSDGSWWQTAHQTVSEKVDNWSQNIDNFLSGKPGKGGNDSYVSMRFGPIFDASGNSGFFDFKARLRLPNTQNRLRLVIESNGENLTSDNQTGESSQDKSIARSAVKSKVSAALRYIKSSWGADFDAGILFEFPLNPFLRARFSQGKKYEQWEWFQREEAFAYYAEGTGLRYRLGFSHKLGDRFSYGGRVGATWFAQDEELYYREDVYLLQDVTQKDQLRYQVSFLQSDGGDTQGDSYLYFIDYSRLLHSNWLIGHIKPQATYKESSGYRQDLSLTLSLEILFGRSYKTS